MTINIMAVEVLRKEFTIQLTNILTPLIYEGLQSIYTEAKNNCNEINLLKNFQSLLKDIKKWSENTIKKELNRIIVKTEQYHWFVKLIQSVFKTNLIILGIDLPSELKKEINLGNFIYNIYMECAREFWIDPYLFNHNLTSLEIKRNNIIIIDKINNAINNAIRRMLPMAIILDKFLGGDKIVQSTDINELYNMPLLLEVPIIKNDVIKNDVIKNDVIKNEVINKKSDTMPVLNNISQENRVNVKYDKLDNINGDTITDKNLEKRIEELLKVSNNHNIMGGSIEQPSNVNNRILNIINNQGIKITDSNSHDNNKPFIKEDKMSQMKGGDNRSSSTLKKIINDSLQQSNMSKKSNGIDSKTKNKLLKEMDSESNTYNPEENIDNYQDIFSNSEIKKDTVNTIDNNDKKIREKFFNNYLNI
jgi:hypothetical protein